MCRALCSDAREHVWKEGTEKPIQVGEVGYKEWLKPRHRGECHFLPSRHLEASFCRGLCPDPGGLQKWNINVPCKPILPVWVYIKHWWQHVRDPPCAAN